MRSQDFEGYSRESMDFIGYEIPWECCAKMEFCGAGSSCVSVAIDFPQALGPSTDRRP